LSQKTAEKVEPISLDAPPPHRRSPQSTLKCAGASIFPRHRRSLHPLSIHIQLRKTCSTCDFPVLRCGWWDLGLYVYCLGFPPCFHLTTFHHRHSPTSFKKQAHFLIPRKSLVPIRPLHCSAVLRSLRFRNPIYIVVPLQSPKFAPINQASSTPTKPTAK
jgi:hypothetical protein